MYVPAPFCFRKYKSGKNRASLRKKTPPAQIVLISIGGFITENSLGLACRFLPNEPVLHNHAASGGFNRVGNIRALFPGKTGLFSTGVFCDNQIQIFFFCFPQNREAQPVKLCRQF